MKPATSSRPATPSIALIMLLLRLTQQVKGFTSVTTHSFNRMTKTTPMTKATRSLPVTSFTPWQYAPTTIVSSSSPSLWYDRTQTTTQLFSSKTDQSSSGSVVPITVLSGFLGSGKTTCLQHLLANNEGLKIAVIVNDVASVNIDSKLVRGEIASDSSDTSSASSSSSSAQPAGLVELQNGCACCSTSGELLSSVSELLTISDLRADDEKFDHIVIEMSGVAEPRSVRNIFQEAMMYDMPLMERVRLDTLCTVVDCSTYGDYLRSGRLANVDESPELFYREGEDKEEDGRKKAKEDGDDDDDDRNLFDMLTGGAANAESGYEGGVCDLLVEQTEVADIVLLNKVDILQGKLQDTKDIVTALNPRAKIISTSYGKIERLEDILGITEGEGVAMDGVVDDHKDYVSAADEAGAKAGEAEAETNCDDADCSDPLHDHDHSHSHSDHSNDAGSTMEDVVGEGGCTDPDSEDTSHSHSHSHSSDNAVAADCADPDCADTSHSHSHSHSSDAETAECADPDCTDTSHSHSHSHSSSDTAAAPLHAGIGSYVYRARRPFHPSRLLSILHKLPVVRGVPTTNQNGDDNSIIRDEGDDDGVNKVFKQVLRSKGFAWTADSNVKAMYWSHAGSSFEMQCLGRWWATLPKQQWPEEVKDSILADYDSLDHDETAASPTTSSVGDRRQEVVFIGPGIGSLDSQTAIKSVLDSCLLNDEEWNIFRSKRDDEASLTCFENPLETRMLTY